MIMILNPYCFSEVKQSKKKTKKNNDANLSDSVTLILRTFDSAPNNISKKHAHNFKLYLVLKSDDSSMYDAIDFDVYRTFDEYFVITTGFNGVHVVTSVTYSYITSNLF